jgi:4'-phosphopantetheinyl transferase EntD
MSPSPPSFRPRSRRSSVRYPSAAGSSRRSATARGKRSAGSASRRASLLPGRSGAPRWPDGVVGSMTHCNGYRATVVAHSGRVRSLGIDAELHAPLPPVLRVIARPEEAATQAQPGRRRLRVQ